MKTGERLTVSTMPNLQCSLPLVSLSQGVQAKVISERLGHSNINITMDLYSHIYEATNIEVAKNLMYFLKQANYEISNRLAK